MNQCSIGFVLWSVWSWFKSGKAWPGRHGNTGLWCITLSTNNMKVKKFSWSRIWTCGHAGLLQPTYAAQGSIRMKCSWIALTSIITDNGSHIDFCKSPWYSCNVNYWKMVVSVVITNFHLTCWRDKMSPVGIPFGGMGLFSCIRVWIIHLGGLITHGGEHPHL